MVESHLLPVWNSFESGLANHLWQSTLFAALAGGMTLLFRKNSAIVRYRLWMAASVKFLIPFSLLIGVGSHLGWHVHSELKPSRFPIVVSQIGQPFAPPIASSTIPARPSRPAGRLSAGSVLAAVWGLGGALILLTWSVKWVRVVRVLRSAKPIAVPGISRIRMLASPAGLEPGVFGILRPVLLLPEGAARNLNSSQMDAIIAHEMVHVRGRDNLAAFVHTIVEAVCWFHPLVWWIGNRLVDERERACDEAVLQAGYEAVDYAAGILTVCECYLKAPACMAGVSGINLKKRIEAIMDYREPRKLNIGMKLMLAAAVAGILVGPIFTGLKASTVRGASAGATPAPVIEIASKAVAPVTSETTVAVPQENSERTVIERHRSTVEPSAKDPNLLRKFAEESQAMRKSESRYREAFFSYVALQRDSTSWTEEVQLIITDAERVAFSKLQSDTERETFVKNFWLQRDPTPGTPQNEFKDEYYSRIAYANAHFAGPSGDPGTKTDRGKIYILNGPPDERETHPEVGRSYNGFSSSVVSTFPHEIWRYRHLEGKGENISYEFVDRQVNGDYRLEYDPSAKDALINVPK